MSEVVRTAADVPVTRIQPSRGWTSLRLGDVWAYRELLFFLVWKEVKVRYKQTLLGAMWAVLQPLLTMIVFTIFFGRLAKVGSDGLPYPIFSYAGLLPWTFFAEGLHKSSASLVGSANLVRKIYFPRLVMPIAAVMSGLVDFSIAFLVLIALMAYYGIWPSAAIVFLPVLLLLALATSLAIGLWLSAFNVRYRDIRYVVPFFIQMWLFVTPVIYPTSRVLARLEEAGIPSWLYGLNPMVGVVEGFRWSLLGSGSRPGTMLLVGSLVTFVLLISGAFYFRRMEKTFADLV
ncbi:MAG: ABC transporter permease [Thermoanaerobaculia bacterium]